MHRSARAAMENAMSLILFAHPFSSYCQKVLVALWEKDIPFEYRRLDDPTDAAQFAALWPLGRFPVLVDEGKVIGESTIIIEYLDRCHPTAPRLVPDDSAAAIEVRYLDRIFDTYVMAAVQPPVLEALRPDPTRLDEARDKARVALDRVYGWLDERLVGRTWAAGECFTMADCAAAPALFYADWVHPVADRFATVRAYRTRLLERPSFARAVDEARYFRPNFPLGAPDRD